MRLEAEEQGLVADIPAAILTDIPAEVTLEWPDYWAEGYEGQRQVRLVFSTGEAWDIFVDTRAEVYEIEFPSPGREPITGAWNEEDPDALNKLWAEVGAAATALNLCPIYLAPVGSAKRLCPVVGLGDSLFHQHPTSPPEVSAQETAQETASPDKAAAGYWPAYWTAGYPQRQYAQLVFTTGTVWRIIVSPPDKIWIISGVDSVTNKATHKILERRWDDNDPNALNNLWRDVAGAVQKTYLIPDCLSSLDGKTAIRLLAGGLWDPLFNPQYAPVPDEIHDTMYAKLSDKVLRALLYASPLDDRLTATLQEKDRAGQLAMADTHTDNREDTTMIHDPMTETPTTAQAAKAAFLDGVKAGAANASIAQARALAMKRLANHPNAPMLLAFFATELGGKLLDGMIVAAVLFGTELTGDALPPKAKEALQSFGHHATVGYGASVGGDVVNYLVPFLADLSSFLLETAKAAGADMGKPAQVESVPDFQAEFAKMPQHTDAGKK